MDTPTYTATLSQSQGRAGWSVIFRHPVVADSSTGQPGRRVRRGLGTRDRDEAQVLCDQLNELLSDRSYWSPLARAQASERFDARVVAAFFDGLSAEGRDPLALRDAILPLPPTGSNEATRRMLLIGTTGAGKTTLLRQLIGTDPERERFPSTSTARTTIHDIEVIIDDGPEFRAVVTFLPSDEIAAIVGENVTAAVTAALRGDRQSSVLRRLLDHVNQRHRLSYVLGRGPQSDEGAQDAWDDDPADVADEQLNEPQVDLTATNELLDDALQTIGALANRYREEVRRHLHAETASDNRIADELLEEQLDQLLRDDVDYHNLVDALVDEVERRFDWLSLGTVNRNKQGWPMTWAFQDSERSRFLEAVNRFSSNYAPRFGTLLTPLVSGIRVAGPFHSTWMPSGAPLVLFDGEGLGHTPQSAATLSTALNRRIDSADAVVLVDSATQPMQAASIAAMKELVARGGARKLILAFTHFDQVQGDNLPTLSLRRQHIIAAVETALSSIGEHLGRFAERALRGRLETACVFLGGLDQRLNETSRSDARTIGEIQKLLRLVEGAAAPVTAAGAQPRYDRLGLALAVKAAAESFQEALWLPRLGLSSRPGIPKEHWTRVRALSRRLSDLSWNTDEYDGLRPVADLAKSLQDELFLFVQNPITWGDMPVSDEQQMAFAGRFAEELSVVVRALASRRVQVERLAEWQRAFAERGVGSANRRARLMASEIYDRAAPIPNSAPTHERNDLLHEVGTLVSAVAERVGAELR